MKSEPKRKATQQGLGKLSSSATDVARTMVRERTTSSPGSPGETIELEATTPSAPPARSEPPVDSRPVRRDAREEPADSPPAPSEVTRKGASGRPIDRNESSRPPPPARPMSARPTTTGRSAPAPARPFGRNDGPSGSTARAAKATLRSDGSDGSARPEASRAGSSRTAVATPAIPDPTPAGPAVSRRRSFRGDASPVAVDDLGTSNPIDAVGLAGRAVPRIVKTKEEIAAAPIDHRAGFLLAHIDGKTTVQGLVDIAGMPEEDVHDMLDRLRRLGIVTIGPLR